MRGRHRSQAKSDTICLVPGQTVAWHLEHHPDLVAARENRGKIRTDRSVQPWLVAYTVWEPTIGAADSNVEDEVKRY